MPRLRTETGQSFVEFTLILPLALVLIFGVVDLGKAVAYWLDSSHLANEGARYAVVNNCPGGPCADLAQRIKDQAESPQLRNDAKVCITYPDGDGAVGSQLKVTATSTYNFLAFLNLAPITITGKSIMRIEQPTPGVAQCST